MRKAICPGPPKRERGRNRERVREHERGGETEGKGEREGGEKREKWGREIIKKCLKKRGIKEKSEGREDGRTRERLKTKCGHWTHTEVEGRGHRQVTWTVTCGQNTWTLNQTVDTD